MAELVVIERRFRGPPASANGGYACGVLGTRAPQAAEVTLRSPPPLQEPLEVVAAGEGRLELRRGDAVVADAVTVSKDVAVPEPVAVDDAAEAARGYAWFTGHPFPGCFVCGPARAEGDGLRIFPGAVRGREVAAAPWRPDASVAGDDGLVRPEIMWAALDCPSWFGYLTARSWDGGGVLLGRLAARVVERPRAGETLVAMGWLLGVDGRKIRCGSAVLGADGRLCGKAEATWIQLR